MKNLMMAAITVLIFGGNIAAEKTDRDDAYEKKEAFHLNLDETSDFALDHAFKEKLVNELMSRHGLDRKAAEKIANIRTCE